MEREILLTGIGGQGVQLAARVLAEAAVAEGRSVQLFGSYSGMMRGGNTDATVVVADTPIESPPTVGRAWSAIVMHDEFAPSTFESQIAGRGFSFVEILTMCPTGWFVETTEAPEYLTGNLAAIHRIGVLKDIVRSV
ncbi:MAG: 2-oxoacid:acceptor oxidoreductase family protein [Actinomycetota bacterium]